jgi:hypothetical protein
MLPLLAACPSKPSAYELMALTALADDVSMLATAIESCAVATLPNASRMCTSTRVGAPAGRVIEVVAADCGK